MTNVEVAKKANGRNNIYQCNNCERMFSREVMFKRHVDGCRTYRSEKKGYDIDAALCVAHDVVCTQNEIGVYNRHWMNPELVKISFNAETDCREVRRGWARRPKWGNRSELTQCPSSEHKLKYS